MKVIYRISDSGYTKVKPDYINNKNCLENAIKCFSNADWLIIGDNLSDDTRKMVEEIAPDADLSLVKIGHGAGTFNIALDYAISSGFSDNEIIYFLENDYLHREGSEQILKDGFDIGADYVCLYDHPDKYIPANKGGNPLIDEDGGELTKVFLGKSCHFKLTNSTTMTVAAKVKTLREDEPILRKWTNTKHPNDMQMFMELRERGRSLVSSIPGYATHGETRWLSPLTDWSKL